jgi:D-glycero-D-manno-heptose 1,7-bisphosphate phosphatase
MKNKAIFLDRDGVINRDVLNYTWKISEFHILDGVFETCMELQKRGYLLIVITNQGGIGKGMYKHEDVSILHNHMVSSFKENGILISEVYYCPHHEVSGKCLCRKPGSLLVEKAVARFNIDPAQSYFVGDRDRDIEAGEGAGVKGILVEVNSNLRKTLPLIK